AVDSTPASAEERRVAGLSTALQDDGTLRYYGDRNKFGLRRGQWTDDTAMALCLADSLLVHGQYHGGDCRIRFFNWWYYGYNNGFASDPHGVRRSVGLGSTIGRSLDELLDHEGADAGSVPWRYLGGGGDAGNGSLMRLAPVAIRYARAPALLLESAAEQSLATHPGSDATVCCLFLAYAMAAALTRPAAAPAPMEHFLRQVIEQFLAEVGQAPAWRAHASMARLAALLRHQPPGLAEANWDWYAAELPLAATLQARAGQYQGHAVNASYFGSYSMDALALALWAMRPATSFSEAILRVVNLLGDADSTGATCSQLAGAWFGLSGIAATAVGRRMLANLQEADPWSEIALRALLLSAQSCDGQ
ncbi:MAG: ADP-ribosylglycohydrolase family protein, partial [Sphingomonadaceae bacterium]